MGECTRRWPSVMHYIPLYNTLCLICFMCSRPGMVRLKTTSESRAGILQSTSHWIKQTYHQNKTAELQTMAWLQQHFCGWKDFHWWSMTASVSPSCCHPKCPRLLFCDEDSGALLVEIVSTTETLFGASSQRGSSGFYYQQKLSSR